MTKYRAVEADHEYERHLDARMARRMAAEDRFLTRLGKREAAAEALVGELTSNGVTMFYVNLRDRDGNLTGKIAKFSREYDAIAYLIRNRYV